MMIFKVVAWTAYPAALLIVPLGLCLGGSTVAPAEGKDPLSPGAVRQGNLDYRTELSQGYLKVYSATDEFDDGGMPHYAHSAYAIYTTDGKLFKNVENHSPRSNESPELVPLPAGSYLVIARSDRHGDVAIRVAIKARQLTVLDLDLGKGGAQTVSIVQVVASSGNRSVVRDFSTL